MGQQVVVSDWRDAEVVPIPKEGDLHDYDNWRGISLLDIAGKVFARILQERLQKVVEDTLLESQHCLRKGRGCADIIFVTRQIVEKTREHNSTLYILFVDLREGYDSVPRLAFWKELEKYGIPKTMLSIIKSFHEGMAAEVRVGNETTDLIEVCNGLRQGCLIAPTLFLISMQSFDIGKIGALKLVCV